MIAMMMMREINKLNLKTKNEKEKHTNLEAMDLFGLGKSVCLVWVYT